MNNASILDSVKLYLGFEPETTSDDDVLNAQIKSAINATLFILMQIGIGPAEGFKITGSTETWGDFMEDMTRFQIVEEYVNLKTRMLFDTPQNASLCEVYNKQLDMMEGRLRIQAETK